MYANGLLWIEADMDNTRNVDAMCRTAIQIQREFQPDAFGIEAEFGGDVMLDNLQQRTENESADLAFNLILVPTNSLQKEVRIRRLTRFLISKMFRFRDTPGTRLLVQQLESFPHGQHDDGPDAAELAVRLAVQSGCFSGILADAFNDNLSSIYMAQAA